MTFFGDEIGKGISIIIEVCITSLNSHFPLLELSTEFGSLVSRGKVWIKVIYTSRETMRTLHINA